MYRKEKIMTRKRLPAVLLSAVLLITALFLPSASAEGFDFSLENNPSIETYTDSDLIYALSNEEEQKFTPASERMLKAGAIDASGTMRSQLSAQGKAFFDKLDELSIKTVKAAATDADGYRQVKFNLSSLSDVKFTGVVDDGNFYFDEASLARYNTLMEDMDLAITAYRYDRPDSIWSSTMKYGFYNTVKDNTMTVNSFVFSYFLHYKGEEEHMWNEMMSNVNVIVKAVKEKNADRYNQVLFVHDLLAQMNEYSSVITDFAYHTSHLAYSSLVPTYGDEPVCDGYAKGFKIILNRLEIPCVTPSSNSGDHMWNNVKMENGSWYNVDLTWDDTGAGHDYFLIGNSTIVGGAAFTRDPAHKEENPYVTSVPKESTTLVFPTKSASAYVYTGTVISNPEITDIADLILAVPAFPDVYKDKWYYSYVEEAHAYGVFSGTDGLFYPGNSITRAEFAQALANYMKFDESQYTSNPFRDVPNDSWASPAVAWANEQGYLVGDGGRFRPKDKISREEMCVVFSRLDRITIDPTDTKEFPDDAQISSWAKDAVYYCKQAGLVSGDTKGNFNPKKSTARSEASKVFVEYIEKK